METAAHSPDDFAMIVAHALRIAANFIEETVRPERQNGTPDPRKQERSPTPRGSTIIALCTRPEGATRKELAEATGSPPTTPWKYDIEQLQKYGPYVVRLSKRNGASCYHLDPTPPN
jgi:hypothetical protein